LTREGRKKQQQRLEVGGSFVKCQWCSIDVLCTDIKVGRKIRNHYHYFPITRERGQGTKWSN